jgi:Gluconate 2-dehydrogenase subunit 3
VAAGRRPSDGLTVAQLALVAAVADVIIPRTDTPGATDVGVPAWINVIVAEFYTDADRALFLGGLDAIDAQAKSVGGVAFMELPAGARESVMLSLDRPDDRQAPAVRGYARLKGLVVHGYFTSERVQKEVLKVEIMPGRFDGSAPMAARNRGVP